MYKRQAGDDDFLSRHHGGKLRQAGRLASRAFLSRHHGGKLIPLSFLFATSFLSRHHGGKREGCDRFAPVSYTHLDVYKRQPEDVLV